MFASVCDRLHRCKVKIILKKRFGCKFIRYGFGFATLVIVLSSTQETPAQEFGEIVGSDSTQWIVHSYRTDGQGLYLAKFVGGDCVYEHHIKLYKTNVQDHIKKIYFTTPINT